MTVTHGEQAHCVLGTESMLRGLEEKCLYLLSHSASPRKLFWEDLVLNRARAGERTPRQRQALQRPLSQSSSQSAKVLKDRQLGWPRGISRLFGSTMRNAQYLWRADSEYQAM